MFNNKVYHQIDALSGSVATLRAEDVKYNEIAEIESRAGTSLAQVIKLDGPNVTLQIFVGARALAPQTAGEQGNPAQLQQHPSCQLSFLTASEDIR